MRAPLSEAARTSRRLGVLGGSFDPPHAGHLHAARAARDAFSLDHVVLVPAARPPHKAGRALAGEEDRLALLALLAGGRPWLSVWSVELERPGPSYTIDTLRALRGATEAELYLVLGSDNLPGFPGWREAEGIVELAQPIVIHRAGDALALEDAALRLSPAAALRLCAGLCDAPPVEASSSELRRRLAQGLDPGAALPEALREYIARTGIYRAA